MPQRHWRQSARGRNSSGASARPSHLRIFSGASGLAHGSAYDAEIWPPLANDVSRPAPGCRSTSVTSCPSAARYHAAVDADDAAAEHEDAHQVAPSANACTGMQLQNRLRSP